MPAGTTPARTVQVSSFGGCMAQVSYFNTARRPVPFLAKNARFVTTFNLTQKSLCDIFCSFCFFLFSEEDVTKRISRGVTIRLESARVMTGALGEFPMLSRGGQEQGREQVRRPVRSSHNLISDF